jgi:hypothetical protein
LGIQAHIADFIQKDASFLCKLELSFPLLNGAGKGSFLMSE